MTVGLNCALVLLAAATTPVHLASAQDAPTKTIVTAAQIESWVRGLDSDSYAERQAAMRNLRRSGLSGVAALTTAARGRNLEATARAIDLLTQLYESTDAEVAIAADDALESLGERGPPEAVVRTQQVLSTTLAPLRRRHAIAAVKRLGGHVIPAQLLDEEGKNEVEADLNEEGTIQHVVIGKKWTGGLAGVKYLQRLPELRTMYITNEIPLSIEEQDKLKAMLAGVHVEHRGSAYLGVKSLPQSPELCIIDNVVPNSPAKRGGMLPGDEITHLDGIRVQGFLSLTAMLAQRKGGDLVYLEVSRDDEFLELQITLGEW